MASLPKRHFADRHPRTVRMWVLVAIWASFPAAVLYIIGAGELPALISLTASWAGGIAYMRARNSELDLKETLEKSEQGSEAKSRFLATVSHEIRTPMNGIVGMTKLLEDTALSAEQRSYTQAVGHSAAALMDLIEDLLDFSKIEAGRIDVERETITLRPFIETLIELLSSRAFEKGLGLSLHSDHDLPESFACDPKHLRQILINLLGNAIKFTETGSVTLEVKVQGAYLEFTIIDTGPGLSEADQDRIFEEFEQADTSSKRVHGGAGLGLAISRNLAQALEGHLSVESQLGEGSAFTLSVPLINLGEKTPEPSSLRGKRCFIWHQCETEAKALAYDLEALGAQCVVTSPLEMEKTAPHTYDVAFMDFRLWQEGAAPEASLKPFHISAKRHCVLIEATKRGRVDDLVQAGFDAYLVRPLRFASLKRITEKLLIDAPADQPKAIDTPQKPLAIENQHFTILVAEDNAVNALLVRATLTRYGHKVTVVGDGQMAVDAHRDGAFDIILMDLHMPNMDGPEAITAIRSAEEANGWRRTPILTLTADGQASTRQKLMSIGADGFLTKPIDPAGLVVEVEKHIEEA